MSMSQLSPFNTTLLKAPGGPSEELVATVPDLHLGVVPVPSGISELNSSESFTNFRKRNRSDSGCSLSDFDISGDEDFSFNNLKRPCSAIQSPLYSSHPYSSSRDLTLELDAALYFDAGVLSSGGEVPVTSSGITIHSSSQTFIDYPLHPKSNLVFTGMQTAELPSNPYKHDLMLNRDQDCKLVIAEHPEEYYRARYGSEGVRAPLKGRTENYPTVEVIGPNCKYVGIVTVKLVHEDGSDHTSCSLDSSEERKNALCKKIGPFNRMTAEFEDLRIRREKRKEGRKLAPTADKATTKEGHSDKVACLLFIATLDTEQGPVVLKAQSKPISLTTAPEPAELDWLEPSRGHFGGQEIVVIKGSKMTSPKVMFRVQLPDGQVRDLHGSVDKERSHQNVLLVRTPSLSQYQFGNHPIQAQVVVITGRNQMPSNPLLFDFIPNHICISCSQEIPHAQFAPLTRAPSALSAAPIYSIHQTPGSPPTTPSIHAQHPAVPNTMCHQSMKTDAVNRSSPDTICHRSAAYSPSSSPACSGVSVLIPTGSVHLQSTASSHSSADAAKPNDDIMQIMHQLISQDYHTNSSNLGASPKHPSHFTMNSVPDNQSASSPYLADINANSPSSDRPQYSPITPSQSPSGVATYPDHALYSLKQKKMITESDYLLFISLYRENNPTFLQAVRAAHGNEEVLLQMLASIKPDQGVYQTSQQ